jgi:hypothetical protein
MNVIVDGFKDLIEVESDEGETLVEFFDEIKTFVNKNDRIISSIDIEGKEIKPPFVDDSFKKLVKDVKEVAIHTLPIKELCLSTVEELDVHLKQTIDDFKKASEIIYSQKYDEATEYIIKAIQRWRYCQEAIDMIVTLVVQKVKAVKETKISNIYAGLNEIIIQLSDAMQNKDYMMLKDVIDYELLDKLKEVNDLKTKLADYF